MMQSMTIDSRDGCKDLLMTMSPANTTLNFIKDERKRLKNFSGNDFAKTSKQMSCSLASIKLEVPF